MRVGCTQAVGMHGWQLAGHPGLGTVGQLGPSGRAAGRACQLHACMSAAHLGNWGVPAV